MQYPHGPAGKIKCMASFSPYSSFPKTDGCSVFDLLFILMGATWKMNLATCSWYKIREANF